MRRGLLLVPLVLAAGTVPLPAAAQTAVRARSRPVAPTPSPVPSQDPPRPAPLQTPAPSERLTLRGLPRRFDQAPACRAQCAETRTTCEAVAETCAPEWNACVRRCGAA